MPPVRLLTGRTYERQAVIADTGKMRPLQAGSVAGRDTAPQDIRLRQRAMFGVLCFVWGTTGWR